MRGEETNPPETVLIHDPVEKLRESGADGKRSAPCCRWCWCLVRGKQPGCLKGSNELLHCPLGKLHVKSVDELEDWLTAWYAKEEFGVCSPSKLLGSPDKRILVVGDEAFHWSASLAKRFQANAMQLVVTTFESQAEIESRDMSRSAQVFLSQQGVLGLCYDVVPCAATALDLFRRYGYFDIIVYPPLFPGLPHRNAHADPSERKILAAKPKEDPAAIEYLIKPEAVKTERGRKAAALRLLSQYIATPPVVLPAWLDPDAGQGVTADSETGKRGSKGPKPPPRPPRVYPETRLKVALARHVAVFFGGLACPGTGVLHVLCDKTQAKGHVSAMAAAYDLVEERPFDYLNYPLYYPSSAIGQRHIVSIACKAPHAQTRFVTNSPEYKTHAATLSFHPSSGAPGPPSDDLVALFKRCVDETFAALCPFRAEDVAASNTAVSNTFVHPVDAELLARHFDATRKRLVHTQIRVIERKDAQEKLPEADRDRDTMRLTAAATLTDAEVDALLWYSYPAKRATFHIEKPSVFDSIRILSGRALVPRADLSGPPADTEEAATMDRASVNEEALRIKKRLLAKRKAAERDEPQTQPAAAAAKKQKKRIAPGAGKARVPSAAVKAEPQR
ncbi:hypothetical protein DIPPA_19314 [Diplonema papillatum]|nr:hypothetical protein DIPPA_19314 [Diplonema papillatum]